VRDRIEELEEEVAAWKKRYEEVMDRLEKKQAEKGASAGGVAGAASNAAEGMEFLGKSEEGTAAMGKSEE